APFGGLQARHLIGAQDDRLRHGGAGGTAECRGENIAVGLVPGSGKSRGDERLSLRECPPRNEGSDAQRGRSRQHASTIHGHVSSAVHSHALGNTRHAASDAAATWTLSPGCRNAAAAARGSLTLSDAPPEVSIS